MGRPFRLASGPCIGMDVFFVSNMMIERLRFEGYSDAPSQFTEDVLCASHQQSLFNAFMRRRIGIMSRI